MLDASREGPEVRPVVNAIPRAWARKVRAGRLPITALERFPHPYRSNHGAVPKGLSQLTRSVDVPTGVAQAPDRQVFMVTRHH